MTELVQKRLALCSLCVLIDARSSAAEFARLVECLVIAGVPMIQLREKKLPDRELLRRARQLRKLLDESETLFIMNDRPDLAVLAAADGVHVGQDELSVADARAIVGPTRLVGVSTHTLAQAKSAVADGADYIGVGPVFPSGTKSFPFFPGIELLRNVADEISIPALAIGGINHANLEQVQAAGFSQIAVSGSVVNASNPSHTAADLLHLLQPSQAGGSDAVAAGEGPNNATSKENPPGGKFNEPC